MRVVDKGLMAMKVPELKEELEARGEGKTGNIPTRPGCAGGCMRPLCASTSQVDTFTILTEGSLFYHYKHTNGLDTLLPF